MINSNKRLKIRGKDKQKNIVIAVLLLLVAIGIGYAALGANLKINGVADILGSSWDVHFKEGSINVTEGSVSGTNVTTTATITNPTQVNYAVKLDLPGDFYEFTVVAENTGSINAMVDSVSSMLGTTEITTGTLPSYIDYSVTYEDDSPITQYHLLAAGGEETYKVRIAFKEDVAATDLPEEATSLNLNFQVNYVQANSSAVALTSSIQPKVPVSATIYWALQDNNNDGDYEKLVIADHEVTGSEGYQGSFEGTREFVSSKEIPWNLAGYNGGSSSNVEELKIEGTVAPKSTAYWFEGMGYYSQSFVGNFSDLNVSNVTNMRNMFDYAGHEATTLNLDLSSWDTSNVTNMSSMFESAGYYATTFNLDLSNWDTSKVTSMYHMFRGAGWETTTFNLDLSSWDTSKVTDMSNMFEGAGSNATTWGVKIPSTNGGGINNTTTELYGINASTIAVPSYAKEFTIE